MLKQLICGRIKRFEEKKIAQTLRIFYEGLGGGKLFDA